MAGDGPIRARGRGIVARRASRAAARPAVRLADRPSLAAETVTARVRALAQFLLFAACSHLDLVASDGERVDELLTAFGQHLYDEGLTLDAFKAAIFAVRALRPVWRRAFPAAWDVAWEWAAIEPSSHHPPMPAIVFQAMVALALLWRWWPLLLQLILGFCAGARPGEACSRRRDHVILPRDVGFEDIPPGEGLFDPSDFLAYVAFPYQPAEGSAPKLTGRRKGSQYTTVGDWDAVQLLDLCLRQLPKGTPLWPGSMPVFRDRFDRVLRRLASGGPGGG